MLSSRLILKLERVSSARFPLRSVICTPQRQRFLRPPFCPTALLPSPRPCRMPPFGPRSPEDIWTLFRSLPHYLIVSAILCLSLCPRSTPPRPPEPSRSHHDASRDCPRAPRHPPSSAALFVSLLLRQNPSSGSLWAPELSYLIHCHLGCLHSVAHPLRTSVRCWDTVLSFALCPRTFFCLSCTLSTLLSCHHHASRDHPRAPQPSLGSVAHFAPFCLPQNLS